MRDQIALPIGARPGIRAGLEIHRHPLPCRRFRLRRTERKANAATRHQRGALCLGLGKRECAHFDVVAGSQIAPLMRQADSGNRRLGLRLRWLSFFSGRRQWCDLDIHSRRRPSDLHAPLGFDQTNTTNYGCVYTYSDMLKHARLIFTYIICARMSDDLYAHPCV